MESPLQLTDEWLALRCQSGEPDAFADLVRTMERPLFYYAAKLLGDTERAADALQDAWVRAFHGIRKLKEPASLRPWLYRVTHGVCVDQIRRDVARERAEEDEREQFEEAAEATVDFVDFEAVHRALDRIGVLHREVLVLHFLEEFSLSEVAAITGCPEGTVKSRIHHAKRALKEVLERGGYGTES